VVGEEVTVVDSAESTAEAALEKLRDMNCLDHSLKEAPLLQTYVSDDPLGVEKFCRFLMPEERIWVGTAQPAMVFPEVRE
jgi:hypothetical protein